MDYLTVALAKGRLAKDTLERLRAADMAAAIDMDSRKLVFRDEKDGIEYLLVKPVDVVTYVEKGVADIGVVGKDIILEQNLDVYELLDLQFGKCAFAIAGFPNTDLYGPEKVLKIATKFPHITRKYFAGKREIETIYLNGSVELAPLMNMSDCIVDLVETGSTLKENGLVVLEKMFDIQAKLIGNRASYQFSYDKIQTFIKAVEREGTVDATDYSWQ
ncbi:MAG: ATP phosphoribosyltransferase [Defluviitaleaceae bacterium]|nr:ATP phosphoribosyltransferase [Defluviitaleaceae bacterium]